MTERLRYLLVGCMALAISGCSIASRSDSFGAEGHIRVGGLLSYIVDFEASFKVGFYRQQPKQEEEKEQEEKSEEVDMLKEFSQALKETWNEDDENDDDPDDPSRGDGL